MVPSALARSRTLRNARSRSRSSRCSFARSEVTDVHVVLLGRARLIVVCMWSRLKERRTVVSRRGVCTSMLRYRCSTRGCSALLSCWTPDWRGSVKDCRCVNRSIRIVQPNVDGSHAMQQRRCSTPGIGLESVSIAGWPEASSSWSRSEIVIAPKLPCPSLKLCTSLYTISVPVIFRRSFVVSIRIVIAP